MDLPLIWAIIIAIGVIMYVIMDGFDLGVGILFPFARSDSDRDVMMNTVARGGCIIAAEVSYSYKPILGYVFKTALNLAHTNYFLPRYGSTKPIKLDTFSSLAATACTA